MCFYHTFVSIPLQILNTNLVSITQAMAFEGWAGGKCSTKAQQSSEILQTKYITRLFNSNLYFVGFPTTEPGFPRVLSQRRMYFSFSSTLAANFGSHWLSCPPRRQETSERMNRISKASGDVASSNSRWGQPERAVWSQWHGRITTGTSCPVQSAIRRRTTAGEKKRKACHLCHERSPQVQRRESS